MKKHVRFWHGGESWDIHLPAFAGKPWVTLQEVKPGRDDVAAHITFSKELGCIEFAHEVIQSTARWCLNCIGNPLQTIKKISINQILKNTAGETQSKSENFEVKTTCDSTFHKGQSAEEWDCCNPPYFSPSKNSLWTGKVWLWGHPCSNPLKVLSRQSIPKVNDRFSAQSWFSDVPQNNRYRFLGTNPIGTWKKLWGTKHNKATTFNNSTSNSIGNLCKTPSNMKRAFSSVPRYCFPHSILAELRG